MSDHEFDNPQRPGAMDDRYLRHEQNRQFHARLNLFHAIEDHLAKEKQRIMTDHTVCRTCGKAAPLYGFGQCGDCFESTPVIDSYDGESGAHLLTMPRECAEDCSRPGAMDEPVAYWRTRVTWVADERTLRRSLKSMGAWDDLETADLDIIKDRVLWCAACDWREENAQSRRT